MDFSSEARNKNTDRDAVGIMEKKTRPIWQIKNDITKVEICTNLTDEEKESMTSKLERELIRAKMKRPI